MDFAESICDVFMLQMRVVPRPGFCLPPMHDLANTSATRTKSCRCLDTKPQPSLTWIARSLGFVTTPFKRLGVRGWTKTGCMAQGAGRPVRNAQHSTDGFFTIDVALTELQVGQVHYALSISYIRLEVEPGTEAHTVCERTHVLAGAAIRFAGPVFVDHDGPFLEIHPRSLEVEAVNSDNKH